MSQLSQQPVLIFADPEPAILRSARRVLHRGHGDWELHFCESIDDAMLLAGSSTPWIIVLDEALLGADLSEAHALFEQAPYALRVILTSSSQENILYGSARIAHLVLPKPFQKEDLQKFLERAIACAQLDMSVELRTCIGALRSLPLLPEVYRQVAEELEKNDPDVDRVSEVISSQPQVLARLLQISNSAIFGFSSPAKDTHQVVMRLGLNMVKHLVLFSGLFSSQRQTISDEMIGKLVQEAQQFAARAQELAERAGYSASLKSNIWVAGLMHNIGKLVILNCAEGVNADLEHLQHEFPSASALLLMLWGFPLEVARAVALQNSTSLDSGEPKLVQLMNATQILGSDDFGPGMLTHIEDIDLRDACIGLAG